MAGLVVYIKPFLAPLWAVAADSVRMPESKMAKTPRHLIHVKRILLWLKAFFRCEVAAIVR
eukprot:3276350-Amphidinium_carterae.1